MFLTPSILLFMVSIIISVILVLSSPSILVAWIALELRALSFIPLILSGKEMKRGESSIKYFLSQTLGSVIILLRLRGRLLFKGLLWDGILLIALALKIGGAPFHAWLPSMSRQIRWGAFYILLTVQKIVPLVILSCYACQLIKIVFLIRVGSLVVGAIGGLIQIQTRKLLVYSSINQVGWLFSSSLLNLKYVLVFFSSYCFILLSVVGIMYVLNINLIKQIGNLGVNGGLLLISLNLLSLGGLPPFIGFFPKWAVLRQLTSLSGFLVFLMVIMSLLTLYFYLRMSLRAFVLNRISWIGEFKEPKMPLIYVIISCISIFGLPLIILV